MYAPRNVNDRSDDQQQIRITGPAEFVAVIPALLGFHPEKSVVAVLMHGTRLICSVRSDLYDDPRPTFDSAVIEQNAAIAHGKTANLQSLVAKGQTWQVEKEPRAE